MRIIGPPPDEIGGVSETVASVGVGDAGSTGNTPSVPATTGATTIITAPNPIPARAARGLRQELTGELTIG